MNANDEIHALRCDRASILQELAQVKEERDGLRDELKQAGKNCAKLTNDLYHARKERDELRALVDHVLLQYDRYHAGEAPADDQDALAWEERARAIRK